MSGYTGSWDDAEMDTSHGYHDPVYDPPETDTSQGYHDPVYDPPSEVSDSALDRKTIALIVGAAFVLAAILTSDD